MVDNGAYGTAGISASHSELSRRKITNTGLHATALVEPCGDRLFSLDLICGCRTQDPALRQWRRKSPLRTSMDHVESSACDRTRLSEAVADERIRGQGRGGRAAIATSQLTFCLVHQRRLQTRPRFQIKFLILTLLRFSDQQPQKKTY